MPATESGTYRVLPGPPDSEELTLLERWSEEPVTVRARGYDEPLESAVADLRPGNLVEATVNWPPEGPAELADLAVKTDTLFEFVPGADHVFEKAEETFREGRRKHAPIASTVTYSTDGEANGALYAIAEQRGTDVFAEFRDGRRTLEPMVEKLGEGGADPPYEAFVIDPVETQFLVVYLAIERGGRLADTVRDEFDCPRE